MMSIINSQDGMFSPRGTTSYGVLLDIATAVGICSADSRLVWPANHLSLAECAAGLNAASLSSPRHNEVAVTRPPSGRQTEEALYNARLRLSLAHVRAEVSSHPGPVAKTNLTQQGRPAGEGSQTRGEATADVVEVEVEVERGPDNPGPGTPGSYALSIVSNTYHICLFERIVFVMSSLRWGRDPRPGSGLEI